MILANFSSPYLFALLYAYKTNLDEAYKKFLIPKIFLENIYSNLDISNKDLRITIIVELLRRGEAPEKIAEVIDWKDFEHIVAKYFEENAYTVLSNYRIKKPRREIDIIAIRFSNLFCIDCKNWKTSLSYSILRPIVDKQLERCCLLKENEQFKTYKIYPLIIVMKRGESIFFQDVPIIPINNLREFIDEIDYLAIKKRIRSLSC